MKRREGFVSNSSSTSFVIALKGEPHTFEELSSMLKLKSDIPDCDCSPDHIVGYILGQIHCYSQVHMSDIYDLVGELRYKVPDVPRIESQSDMCDLYRNKNKKCNSECPISDVCFDKYEYGTFEWNRRASRIQLMEFDKASKLAKNFVEKTLGYKYYYIVFEGQSALGSCFGKHHEAIFKNIKYICLTSDIRNTSDIRG